ncbi:polysaccharide deacetylase [Alicycliphilus sp. B1]|nr:polysaccharide deacetylase [Alicycliphilus sp. B1]
MPCGAQCGSYTGLLDDRGVRATFFTLGWIAERYPAMVRRIVDGGHELASHGYGHERASDLSETDFFNDVHRAKALLEDIGGMLVLGTVLLAFIGSANMWALDTLRALGTAIQA